MDNLIPLRILGLSIAQVRTGAHVLILEQIDGPYRIPVVIGANEAQAIATKLEGITPPRPLTHDLFAILAHAFAIQTPQILIYRFEDGIFYSEITFTLDDRTVTLDARTSDAIAIAMRTGAPIFTTPEVLAQTGFEMEITPDDPDGIIPETSPQTPNTPPADNLHKYSIPELEKLLQRHIDAEEYEQAAAITQIIQQKKDKTE